MTILVGGVGELYQGDLDLGRRAADLLAAGPLPQGVLVEELTYGAVGVVHRLRELSPSTLIVVGATRRGRPPGTVERRRVEAPTLTPDEAQAAVGDAVTGYVGIDLLVEVAAGLDALPGRVVAIDVEPASLGPSVELSAAGEAALAEAVALARAEVQRTPLLELAALLRERLSGERLEPAPAVATLRALLGELERLDRHGQWGAAFRERDRLELHIAAGRTGQGMDHLDWGLWWTLIEEMDRLQQLEALEGAGGKAGGQAGG